MTIETLAYDERECLLAVAGIDTGDGVAEKALRIINQLTAALTEARAEVERLRAALLTKPQRGKSVAPIANQLAAANALLNEVWAAQAPSVNLLCRVYDHLSGQPTAPRGDTLSDGTWIRTPEEERGQPAAPDPRDAEIARLQFELKAKSNECEIADGEIERLQSRIDVDASTIAQAHSEVARLTEALAAAESQRNHFDIERLKANAARLDAEQKLAEAERDLRQQEAERVDAIGAAANAEARVRELEEDKRILAEQASVHANRARELEDQAQQVKAILVSGRYWAALEALRDGK
jgi:hypothetical protein